MKNFRNSGNSPVTTYSYQPSPSPNEKQMNPVLQQDWFTFKIVEETLRNSKYLDHSIFDDLKEEGSTKGFYLKNFLKSIEKLALHWELLDKKEFEYRIKSYDNIEGFVNEIPRVSNGSYFSIKTFLLSCRRLHLQIDCEALRYAVY